MAQAWKCDICGKHYDGIKTHGGTYTDEVIFGSCGSSRATSYSKFYDVCPECFNAIKETIKNRKVLETIDEGGSHD